METVALLQSVIDQSFEPVTALLDGMHNSISERIGEMENTLDELNDHSKDIEKNLSDLNERITSMSTPFGPIPLRANELITLFPILLALVMVFAALSLAKSSHLYTELWEQYKVDGNESVREFQFLTDCWYLPPYRSVIQPMFLILFAATITGIYLYSCYLIWTEPVLFSFAGLGEETFRRAIFRFGYVTGLLVITISIWYGYRNIRKVPELPHSS